MARKSGYKKKGKKKFMGAKPSRTLTYGAPVPDKKKCQMVYNGYGILDTSSTGFDIRFVTMNGLWDVDISGVGHQPQHYDTMSLLYNKYRVVSSKIVVDFPNPGIAGPSHTLIVAPLDTTTGWGQGDSLVEKPYSVSTVLGPNTTVPRKLIKSMSIRKQAGRNNIEQVAELSANIASQPAEIYYFGIAAATFNGVAGHQIPYRFKITFNTEWFDRADDKIAD